VGPGAGTLLKPAAAVFYSRVQFGHESGRMHRRCRKLPERVIHGKDTKGRTLDLANPEKKKLKGSGSTLRRLTERREGRTGNVNDEASNDAIEGHGKRTANHDVEKHR
jgi:hypothetical protein